MEQSTTAVDAVDGALTNKIVGQRLGGFEVLRPIGAGGMGAVFMAQQVSVGREVALKVVPDHGDEMTRARFVREARSIASLSHPNIVQLFDYGVDEEFGLLYYAMEFIEGKTLQSVIDRGRLHPALALDLAMQMCSALAQTHAQDVIHRDLKAANVVLTFSADGQLILKLLDFGIAHVFEDTDHRLTHTGLICGTPSFMAPELVDGQKPTPQADLYALGINLFFMLSGRLPFQGRSAIEIVMRQVHGEVPTLAAEAAQGLVPPKLAEVVEHLMAKTSEERPTSAAQVRAQLAQIRAELQPAVLTYGGDDPFEHWTRPKLHKESSAAMPAEWFFGSYDQADDTTFTRQSDKELAEAETERIPMVSLGTAATQDAVPSTDVSREPVLRPRSEDDGGWGAFNRTPQAQEAAAEAYEFEPMTGPFKPVSGNPSPEAAKPEGETVAPKPEAKVVKAAPLALGNRPRGARQFTAEELVPDLEKLQQTARPAELHPVRQKIAGRVGFGIAAVVLFAVTLALVYTLLTAL